MPHWISAVSRPLIGWAVSAHLLTNSWSDWVQICWASSIWHPPAWLTFNHTPLTEFLSFPSLLLLSQFLCVCEQTVEWIEVKLHPLIPSWLKGLRTVLVGLLSLCTRVHANKKSHSRARRVRNWIYCRHVPKMIVPTNPDRPVLITIITRHF